MERQTLQEHRADRAEVVRDVLLAAGYTVPARDRLSGSTLAADGLRRFVWSTLPARTLRVTPVSSCGPWLSVSAGGNNTRPPRLRKTFRQLTVSHHPARADQRPMESEPNAQPVSDITDEELAMLLGSSARQRLVPPVAQRSDEDLVRLSGLQRISSHEVGDFGFQAGSELIRRLTKELRDSRLQAKESAEKLERYTRCSLP